MIEGGPDGQIPYFKGPVSGPYVFEVNEHLTRGSQPYARRLKSLVNKALHKTPFRSVVNLRADKLEAKLVKENEMNSKWIPVGDHRTPRRSS